MSRFRTIRAAYEEIKTADPGTALTEWRIRRLVVEGEIPSRRMGAKYIIDLDYLLRYLADACAGIERQKTGGAACQN